MRILIRVLLSLCLLPSLAQAVGTFIPATYRTDMVYDAPRDILYITALTNVLRYQLTNDSFLPPFELSGSLAGIDLSPDGNTLVVADQSGPATNTGIHVIDLRTGQAKRIFFPPDPAESGTFAVAFGSDGAALISSAYGFAPLRRYDPVSDTFTMIHDDIGQASMVSASADRKSIVIAEAGNSGGEFDLYDVTPRTIIKASADGWFNYECAANRDGSLFAIPVYGGTQIYDRNFSLITTIGGYAGAQPIGVAFHPLADAVFFPFYTTKYVYVYSTRTWEVLAQFDFQDTFMASGVGFGQGRTRISPDGKIIFVTVTGGVRYLRHNLNLQTQSLLVTGNPESYGIPTPIPYGTNWLFHGTNLTIQVPAFVDTNGTRYVSAGWTGTGSIPANGTTNSVTFTLLADSTLTWNWTPFVLSANSISQLTGPQFLLQWPSTSGKTYDVLSTSNLFSNFAPIASNLPATPPTNIYQVPLTPTPAAFYRIEMK